MSLNIAILHKNESTKICVIGDGIFKAMNGNIAGGAEKQQALIIKGLKSKGFEVIVLEYFLKEKKSFNGIDFFPTWDSNVKSFLKKIKGLINELNKHEIDVIYARTTQLYIAILFVYLKINKSKIKLFWGIGGDEDLTTKLNYSRINSKATFYRKINSGIIFNISSMLTFYFADKVICQTTEQIKKCETILKNKSTILISNIYSRNKTEIFEYSKIDYDAIWIGKFAGNKGEDILLKLSKKLPELKILCLGQVSKNFERLEVYNNIKTQKNIYLMGRVDAHQVPKYIAKANFVLNTSPSEGLSNVFLEGWDLSKPVISFVVNPNEYLSTGNAGYCAKGSLNNLVNKIKLIKEDREFLSFHGEKGKEILERNHNPELILSKYEQLFINL